MILELIHIYIDLEKQTKIIVDSGVMHLIKSNIIIRSNL
jgi:hypothetical protein